LNPPSIFSQRAWRYGHERYGGSDDTAALSEVVHHLLPFPTPIVVVNRAHAGRLSLHVRVRGQPRKSPESQGP